MDLSSPSCSESPLHPPSPSLNKKSTPEPSERYQSPINSQVLTSFSPKLDGVVPRCTTNVVNSPEVKLVTTSTQVCETPEPPREPLEALSDPPLVEAPSRVTSHNPPPDKLEAATSITNSPQTPTWKPETTYTMTNQDFKNLRETCKTSNPTLYKVPSAIAEPFKPHVLKGATRPTKSTITLSDLFVKATSSASGFSHADSQAASPEVGNKILNGIVDPQGPVRNSLLHTSLILIYCEVTQPYRERVCVYWSSTVG
jgi:hypothetical protein